jgi:hypothetical protein
MPFPTIQILADLTTQKRLSVEAIEQWIAQNPNPDIEFYLRMMLLGSVHPETLPKLKLWTPSIFWSPKLQLWDF